MKQKLLTLVLFLITAVATAQVQAYQVPDMVQCDLEVFDLTTQIPAVLANQNPADHAVTFHISLASAQSGTNAIADPTFFVSDGQQQTVYIRVTKLSDSTYATTSFLVKWDQSYYEYDDQDVCNQYILPALQNITYYTHTGGSGTQLAAGTSITSSQTIYFIYDNQMGCSGEGSFMVNVNTVNVNQPAPFVLCDFMGDGIETFDLTSQNGNITNAPNAVITYFTTLQDATANVNFITNPAAYTAPSATIYARVTLGNCFEIVPLMLQVTTNQFADVPDITACESYALPALTVGQYYTGPNGTGTVISPGDLITTSQTIYIFSPECGGQTSFTVTINPVINPSTNFSNVFACNAYTLPAVAGVTYLDMLQQPLPAGTVITATTSVYAVTSGQCGGQYLFTILIGTSIQQGLQLYGCDADNTGTGTFDLTVPIMFIPEAELTYYASEADAIAQQNPLDDTYVNASGQQFLYGRVTYNSQVCTEVYQIELITEAITVQGPQTLQACDPDNDGVAVFNLLELSNAIWATNSVDISYHETISDAEFGSNAIPNTLQYYNAVPYTQTIYLRLFNELSNCLKILPVTLQTNPGCTPNSVSGTVRFDSDGGGCSVSDTPAQNISVYNIIGNIVYQTFTNADGNYSFEGTPNGANILSVTQVPQNLTVTPGSQTVTLPGTVTGQDFCLSTPNPVEDVMVTLIPVTQARPGFPATYLLIYSNVGTLPLSGVVTVYFPNAKVSYLSSYPAMTLSGNALSISYVNLLPYQSQSHYITFEVQPPQVVPLGDILTYAATVTPVNDNDPTNNTSTINQVVVNSYDPNDISVLEGETITEVQADGYLHYTIRFQNIGNADAIRVRIENPLDSNLDFNTIQPLGASHEYHLQRKNGHLTFTFNDIYLPGSQYDEPGSHGFITYRIKPKAAVTIGDSMSNNASIYFDFNDPIATNTVTTTVQLPAGTADFAAKTFSMYPNPANGLVTLKLNEMTAADVLVTDVLGKTVLTSKVTQQEQSLDIAGLNSGIYFVKVTTEGKSATRKLVVR